jgi:hypothetical protein
VIENSHRRAAERHRADAKPHEPQAQRRHEGGDAQDDMHEAVQEAKPGARCNRQHRSPPAEVVVVAVVGAEQRHDHRADREHAFDGQIDAAHQNNEGRSHRQDQGDGGGIRQAPDEIAKAEEAGIEQA